MKKFEFKTLVTICAVLTLLAFSSCKDDDGDEEASTLPNGWTSAQKTEWMTNCNTVDEDNPDDEVYTEAQCECIFEKISEKHSYEEVENASLETAFSLLAVTLECL